MRDGAPLFVVYICIQLYCLIGRLNKDINNKKESNLQAAVAIVKNHMVGILLIHND